MQQEATTSDYNRKIGQDMI